MDTIAAIVGAIENRALFESIIGHAVLQHERFGVTLWRVTVEQQTTPTTRKDGPVVWVVRSDLRSGLPVRTTR
jgi:hypothetical protein